MLDQGSRSAHQAAEDQVSLATPAQVRAVAVHRLKVVLQDGLSFQVTELSQALAQVHFGSVCLLSLIHI